MNVVPIYAAVLAVAFIMLSATVIRARQQARVALGFGADEVLQRRIRVHGNFAEYVPFALLLIAMAEMGGAPLLLIHALCILLIAGRVAHAWGVSRLNEDPRLRVAGMAATLTTIGAAALTLLLLAAL